MIKFIYTVRARDPNGIVHIVLRVKQGTEHSKVRGTLYLPNGEWEVLKAMLIASETLFIDNEVEVTVIEELSNGSTCTTHRNT